MNNNNNSKRKKYVKQTTQILFYTTVTTLSIIIVILIFLIVFPKLPLSKGPLAKIQAYTYATRKILFYSINSTHKETEGAAAQTVINNIIAQRAKNTYLYTGGHYTDFYIRNLGTFANKLVDPQASDTATEWLERVTLVERSTNLALSVFSSYNEITTTIVQLENGKYVPINIYVRPSDSLPSLLKVLDQLRTIKEQPYPFDITPEQQAQIDKIQHNANAMLYQHNNFLKYHIEKYITEYTDPETKLIKKDLALSGIKDAWIRQSPLYDNVMLYLVYKYGHKLNLYPDGEMKALQVKEKLLHERWDSENGIFYDELPPPNTLTRKNYFSADTLITYEMGMLDPRDPNDRKYLESIITYIQTKKLDQPFPLQTTEIRIPSKEHLPVRIFAPNYIGTTIWSYWGMVYINLLSDVEQTETARIHLDRYKNNIEQYHGFPELYNTNGKPYKTFFYRSVNDMIWGIYYLYLDNKIN